MSTRRWRRGESRRRLLDAALEAIAEAGPSGVSGRKIAQAADVHHAQIQQMFGSVDVLLETSLLNERDRYLAEVLAEPAKLSDPFAPLDYPYFWRAIAQVVLDPGPINLASLAAGGPVQRVESQLPQDVVNPSERFAIASAWLAMPLGFMVFEDAFGRGLGLSARDIDHCRDRIRDRLTDLASARVLPDRDRELPAAIRHDPTPAPSSARARLVNAAEDLLATRLETSIRGRELADHAGVNYGLISHYFGSKSAVFDEALTDLHARLTNDAVRRNEGQDLLGGPDVFTRHRTFIRAWASRLIGGRPTPDFELVGMRALIESTRERRGSAAKRVEAIGDVLAATSLGLGWAVLSPLATAGDADTNQAITHQIYRVHYWLLDG